MKTYDEIKAQYESLNQRFEEALEAAVFGCLTPEQLEGYRKQRDLCGELLRLRLQQPLFGGEK